MRSLKIAGIERVSDLEKDSLTIQQALTNSIDTCSFKVKGHKPAEGEEVIIDDGVRMFAGIIVKVVLSRSFPDKSIQVWDVDCDDYTEQLNRRLVVERYSNLPAHEIFLDIVTKYCPGFTATGVVKGGPVVEWLPLDYVKGSEAFNQLAKYIGWHWDVDYYKDLKFFPNEMLTAPAPMELVPGGFFSGFKHSIDTQNLRNRVYVRGGKMRSDFYTYETKADGVSRIWTLPHKPHDLEFTTSLDPDTPLSVGIENIHKETDYPYLMNYQEKYVRATDLAPTIPEGATLRFKYKYDIDIITISENIESQQALAAVQGGDGVYEHVVVDESLNSLEAAEAAGLADINENSNPKVKGSFITPIPGWKPGQLVNVNLSDRGITGTFLVQKVVVRPIDMDPFTYQPGWIYQVEYGGKLLGIADFLKALVSAQQNKQIGETNIIHKFVYGKETAGVKDEFIFTPRSEPWKVEVGKEKIVKLTNIEGLFNVSDSIQLIGKLVRIINLDSKWTGVEYNLSADGSNWLGWNKVDYTKSVNVGDANHVKFRSSFNPNLLIKNWKSDEQTDVICGMVVVM